MKIGIDIDGCLYPWTRAANEALMSRFGIDDPGEHLDWDYLERVVGRKKFGWLWTSEAAEMVFGRLDLIYPNCADVVNRLTPEHTVHFVTHRNPYRTAGVTGHWLRYHFKDYAGVHVLNNRVPKWELGSWDVFIDDKAETCSGFVQYTSSRVLMPKRPWNTHLQVWGEENRGPNGFFTFDDWNEVEALIRGAVPA